MALNCYPWKLGLGRPWVGVIGHAWGKLFGGKTPDDRNLSLGFGKEGVKVDKVKLIPLKKKPYEMDVAPWCYKWMGWD